eukprot:6189543-Pleurochrysis_carterae.AAC.3
MLRSGTQHSKSRRAIVAIAHQQSLRSHISERRVEGDGHEASDRRGAVRSGAGEGWCTRLAQAAQRKRARNLADVCE